MAVPHDVLQQASRNHGLLRRDQLHAADLTNKQIRHLAGTGELVAVHHNVFRLGGAAESWKQRQLAACFATSGLASHRAALKLWLPSTGMKGTEGTTVEVTVARRNPPRPAGVVVHRSPGIASVRPWRRSGIPVTTPQRMLVDLAAVVDMDMMTRAVEHCIATRLLSVATIRAELEQLPTRGRQGVDLLRRVIADWPLDDARPDSTLEIAFARLCHIAGIPTPCFQHEVTAAVDAVASMPHIPTSSWPSR